MINNGFSRASVDISGQINRVNLVGNSMYIMALDSADFDAEFYTKQLESGLSLIGRGDMSFTAVGAFIKIGCKFRAARFAAYRVVSL